MSYFLMPLILAELFVAVACVAWLRRSPSWGIALMIAGMILSAVLLLPQLALSLYGHEAITPFSDALIGVEPPHAFLRGDIFFGQSSFRFIAYMDFVRGTGLCLFALGLWMESKKAQRRFEANRTVIHDER